MDVLIFCHIISYVVILLSQLPQNNDHLCAQYADRRVSPIWSWITLFKESALWADAFYKLICPYVCVSVCSVFEVPFKHLFAPTSQSRMSKNFRDSESLGKSNGKKWSQMWSFLFGSGLKSPRKKKLVFLLILPYKTWWKPRFPMD